MEEDKNMSSQVGQGGLSVMGPYRTGRTLTFKGGRWEGIVVEDINPGNRNSMSKREEGRKS